MPFLAGFIFCAKFGVKAVVYTLHKVWSEGGGLYFALSLESRRWFTLCAFQTPQSDAVLPVAVLPEGNHLATF